MRTTQLISFWSLPSEKCLLDVPTIQRPIRDTKAGDGIITGWVFKYVGHRVELYDVVDMFVRWELKDLAQLDWADRSGSIKAEHQLNVEGRGSLQNICLCLLVQKTEGPEINFSLELSLLWQ